MKVAQIKEYCLQKPKAYKECPFGEVPICYKLHGKIFAQLYPYPEDFKITLKCTVEAGQFYRMVYPGKVVRGYHCPPVQQPYWNTVLLGNSGDSADSFTDDELLEMIDQAYETVFKSFSKKVQQEIMKEEDIIKLVPATEVSAEKVMQLRQSFLSAGERSINGSRGLHNYDNYEDWLWLVKECEKPDNTLLGVQASTYFAVRVSDGTVVGCIELRHTLNESLAVIGGHIGYSVVPLERRKGYATKMLELVLLEAKKAGLDKVMLTCDTDNVSSCKTIERCGGKREQETPFVLDGETYFKYWIEL